MTAGVNAGQRVYTAPALQASGLMVKPPNQMSANADANAMGAKIDARTDWDVVRSSIP